MADHAYFDRTFSERFVEILEGIYDEPETADKLWEENPYAIKFVR